MLGGLSEASPVPAFAYLMVFAVPPPAGGDKIFTIKDRRGAAAAVF